jgi:poly [ADP-ribose] polymerase
MTDMLNGNNKHYVIELHQSNGKYRIYTCYGRTGASHSTQEERFPDNYNAVSEYNSIKNSKIKKGYRLVILATTSKGTSEGNSKIWSDDVKKDKIAPISPVMASSLDLDDNTARLVERLYQEAGDATKSSLHGSLKSTAENPLGTLTLGQINAGKQILQEINKFLTNKPDSVNSIDNGIVGLTNEFYCAIPQEIPLRPKDSYSREQWLKKYCLNNATILDEKNDLLELLSDVQGMLSGFSTTDVGKKYLEMNCNLVYRNDHIFNQIKSMLEGSQSKHHNWKLSLKRLWEVETKAQKNHLDIMTKIGNTKALFHGSRLSNILGICKKGILIRPAGVYITVSLYGNGAYFADQSTKSSQYSTERFGGYSYGNSYSHNITYFLFLANVALGRIKEYHNGGASLTKAPDGYDSVKGCAGSYLVHNEYIIYDIRQHKLNYLLEFEQRYS